MDIAAIERRLESGESLKVKYRFPLETEGYTRDGGYGVRSDRLVDVSSERGRLFAKFQGRTPIWIDSDEVIDVLPDDGIYEDFPAE